jgi:hypothetical protein
MSVKKHPRDHIHSLDSLGYLINGGEKETRMDPESALKHIMNKNENISDSDRERLQRSTIYNLGKQHRNSDFSGQIWENPSPIVKKDMDNHRNNMLKYDIAKKKRELKKQQPNVKKRKEVVSPIKKWQESNSLDAFGNPW